MGTLQTTRPSRMRQAATSLAASLLLTLACAAEAAPPVEREFDQAVRSFRAGRTSEAFGQFIELANRGDVDAARIALFMHSYGPVLYGKHWDAGAKDVAYWSQLVRNSGTSGRPLPEFQPTVLTPGKGKARPAAPKARPAPELASVANN